MHSFLKVGPQIALYNTKSTVVKAFDFDVVEFCQERVNILFWSACS